MCLFILCNHFGIIIVIFFFTKKLAWSEDYLVLGQNYLTSLKDKITCFRNEIRVGEFSENLDKAKESPLLKVWHFLCLNKKRFKKYCFKQNLNSKKGFN